MFQFSKEEVNANKDIIAELKSQIDNLEKERETLVDMQPNLTEGQLLDILRHKDHQIVQLEGMIREKDTLVEMLRDKISKHEKELSTYAHIVEVKDRSIIKLSNDLHEFDLKEKIEQQQLATPLSVGVSGSGVNNQQFVFCEKVGVGCQTETEKQKESLQDMVSAFLMQNKFLNKEVLELNQLRQQGLQQLLIYEILISLSQPWIENKNYFSRPQIGRQSFTRSSQNIFSCSTSFTTPR